MDANGLRFWMLAEANDWRLEPEPENNSAGAAFDRARRTLRLVSRRTRPREADANATLSQALSRLELVPQARDGVGTRAYWDAVAQKIQATGALPDAIPILDLPTARPTDLAMGYDDVLYVALETGAVIMNDRRGRWRPVELRAENFTAWRIAADPQGGMWILDRMHRRLGRLQGLPFRERPFAQYDADVFRPCRENPHPPELTVFPDAVCANDETPAALACSPDGHVALLTWNASGECFARIVGATERGEAIFVNGAPVRLQGARYGFSIAWASHTRLAVLLTNEHGDAAVYEWNPNASSLEPVGDIYPLRDYGDGVHRSGPFAHGLDLPPHFPTRSGTSPLYHLSLPSFAPHGTAANVRALDSGSAQTVWHRLYLEADIPPRCAIEIWLAASDDGIAPTDADEWHPHYFGDAFAPDPTHRIPRGAWTNAASEVPFYPALLPCPRVPQRSGLFTVLIQRAHRRVRSLRGRFLHVRAVLTGEGGASPELAALRAYASRFSYVENYLPALYHENVFGPDADEILPADEPAASTPADFLERFVNNFESILTPLEDRISHSYLLTDARAAPADALDWLGGWIGVSYDPALSEKRRRMMLRHAPQVFKERGTVRGLEHALEITTGGAVSGGEIIVLEDYRLRRTFVTILGADLAATDDPLLAGISVSGNSYVGDTLFLGDENRREFLALFADDLPKNAAEQYAITDLYDRLAYRVTVLVHQEVEPQDLGLIRRVVELETPAHVEARVLTATQPFMVGIASLVGVDTYLASKPQPQPARVDTSQIGVRDFILGTGALDPRLEAGWYDRSSGSAPSAPPIAELAGPARVEFGETFMLDGSGSRAAPGRTIVRYLWQLTE